VFEIGAGIDSRALQRVLQRLPPLNGGPIYLARAPDLRDRSGPVHGGAFLRQRRILFDCTRAEFPRIFVHELFHFVWVRGGNPMRRSFEILLAGEIGRRARGELGWAAESRKLRLTPADVPARTRRWREYCCESFCDTGAWLYSGLPGHPEFTLGSSWQSRRRDWFSQIIGGRNLEV
jgi:hypothetical protein